MRGIRDPRLLVDHRKPPAVMVRACEMIEPRHRAIVDVEDEAFLRLTDARHVRWQDRAHFLGISARLMRRVLVDYARRRGFQKRGGGAQQVTFDEGLVASADPALDIVALDRALEALAQVDVRKSRVIELRFFGGLTVEETAEVLNVSPDTVKRDWRLAKLWLLRELEGEEP